MPTAYGGRMSKRLSQAPRLSVVMAGDEVIERKTSVKEFLCNHVKTIATLVMIFATIICIVLIVMVHKWKYENEQALRIDACLDVVVVGSGISGAYAAWRLRTENLQVALLETSDRVGGRMYTWHPHEHDFKFPGPAGGHLHGELGALFYLPQQHPLLNRTIHALRLTPVEFRPPNHDPPMLYLRGQSVMREISKDPGLPYKLLSDEQGRKPQDLKIFYLEKLLANGSNLQKAALYSRDRDGKNLYKQKYWNLINRVASLEGRHFLHDSAPWRSFAANGNAALLSSISVEPNVNHMTLYEGMDAVPKALVDEFLNASLDHSLHKNRRLGCITKERGFYDMIFLHTETQNDVTEDHWDSTTMCAKSVILALPPPALKHVEWKKFTADKVDANDGDRKLLHERLDSLEVVPALVAYFVYDRKWWKENHEPWMQDVITDLPLKRVRYIGQFKGRLEFPGSDYLNPEYDSHSDRHVFMVANLDSSDYEYFSSLLNTTVYDGFLKVSCSNTSNFVQEVTRQLAVIYGVKAKDIPAPESMYVVDWSRAPSGGGRFMWKSGVMWDRVAEELQRPRDRESIFVVGDAYCPGQCQLWVEGALQTVDTMLSAYADKFLPGYVKDS